MNKDFLKLGIIGNPLSHSISPILQEAAIKSVGKTGDSKKFECSEAELSETINYLVEKNMLG